MNNPFNKKIDKRQYKIAYSSEEKVNNILRQMYLLDKKLKRPRITKEKQLIFN